MRVTEAGQATLEESLREELLHVTEGSIDEAENVVLRVGARSGA